MTRDDLEMLACLAWEFEKEKCRRVNRSRFLQACSVEQIPYWLGPLTQNMETGAWHGALNSALVHYKCLEKENETRTD